MAVTWASLLVLIGCICHLVIVTAERSDDLPWQDTSLLMKRLRRNGWGDSWSVIMPPAVATKCYAQPCTDDLDCCLGYICSSLDELVRRSRPIQYCTEEEEDFTYYR